MTAVKKPDPLKVLRQKVQVLRRQVAALADDDVWRPFLANHAGGKTSTREMTERQLIAVVKALHAAGAPKQPAARPAAAKPFPYADCAQTRMLRAIWAKLGLHQAIDNPAEEALADLIAKLTGQQLGRLTNTAVDKVKRVLKAMGERKGVEIA